MIIKTRRFILLGIIAIVILVSIWGLLYSVLAPENGLGSTDLQDLTANEVVELEEIAYLMLDKCPGGTPPETYVELTEEEACKFPVLQAALQALEESNQTQISYKTTYKEASRFREYIFDKYRDLYGCEVGCERSNFEYRGELYWFGVMVTEKRETTSDSSQPTPVSEGPSASGVMFLPYVTFIVLYAHSKKRK